MLYSDFFFHLTCSVAVYRLSDNYFRNSSTVTIIFFCTNMGKRNPRFASPLVPWSSMTGYSTVFQQAFNKCISSVLNSSLYKCLSVCFQISKESIEEWSFPDLVEITDFLLVYHVEGLTSLAQLFPNLAVIRGMKLLERYSLVIYKTHIEVRLRVTS